MEAASIRSTCAGSMISQSGRSRRRAGSMERSGADLSARRALRPPLRVRRSACLTPVSMTSPPLRCLDAGTRQRSTTRSLSGFEQQIRTLFCAISRGRMPPLCCMSTVPESSVVLQVPHMPCPQDDDGLRPAA